MSVAVGLAYEQSTHTVFLVDDHPIVRQGYTFLIKRSSGLTVAGEAGSGEEALKKIPTVHPDLAIVDISMEGMDGIELTRRLQHQVPELPVLIVSMHHETSYARRALEAGARGYMTKSNLDATIADAIHQVLDGEIFLENGLKERLDYST